MIGGPNGGDLLGARYRILARLATGGMGEVWRATDEVLGREVAVKLLKAEYADDPTFRARFAAEARNTAALVHPGVAQVFDFGEVPGPTPTPYLVMELVAGVPLSDLLANEGALPPRRAVDLVAQAAAAVGAAHDQGIVHRDVKPANLMVGPGDQVKVTDFGIARAADAVPLTETGQVIGTAHYLSPEQAGGYDATPASDVYALGVVLYECLAGRRPFTGPNAVAVSLAHLREAPPALPEHVPSALAAVCRRALAKDPAERPRSAGELASRLRAATGEVVGAAVRSPARRGRSLLVALAVLAGLGLGGGLLAAAFDGGGAEARGPERGAGVETRGPERNGGAETPGPERNGGPNPGQVTATGLPPDVSVDAEDYVGLPVERVTRSLAELGLDPKEQTLHGGGPPGTVADITPTGDLPVGSAVTVLGYDHGGHGGGGEGQGPDGEPNAGGSQGQGGGGTGGEGDGGEGDGNEGAGNGGEGDGRIRR